jgi:hypothetical protein
MYVSGPIETGPVLAQALNASDTSTNNVLQRLTKMMFPSLGRAVVASEMQVRVARSEHAAAKTARRTAKGALIHVPGVCADNYRVRSLFSAKTVCGGVSDIVCPRRTATNWCCVCRNHVRAIARVHHVAGHCTAR